MDASQSSSNELGSANYVGKFGVEFKDEFRDHLEFISEARMHESCAIMIRWEIIAKLICEFISEIGLLSFRNWGKLVK